MTTLTLYYTPGTCALAVHIALHEAQAGHELVRLDFAAQQQRSPEYLAINPKGRVPALVTEHGVLTETPALLAYVAQRYAQAQLAPLDPFAFARMQEFNNYLASTVHVAHAHRPRASRWADEPASHADMLRKVPQNMAECFGVIERHYLHGPWVLGEPLRNQLGTPALMALAVYVMLYTQRSPVWPMAVGALVGALGWMN